MQTGRARSTGRGGGGREMGECVKVIILSPPYKKMKSDNRPDGKLISSILSCL